MLFNAFKKRWKFKRYITSKDTSGKYGDRGRGFISNINFEPVNNFVYSQLSQGNNQNF